MAEYGRFDWRTAVLVVFVAVSVVVGMIIWGDESDPTPGPTNGRSTPAVPAMSTLVFATWGSPDEIDAYRRIVHEYNTTSQVVDVRVAAYPDPVSMMADIDAGKIKPDLYLIRHEDLASTMEEHRNQPLQDLLDARAVHVSDSFARDGINAFSAADDLQCMPYTASPMVIYYNTDLIDFDRMDKRGLPTPDEEHDSFSLDEFAAAAQYASRPRTHAKGVQIAPTLTGLAPFVYSGAGGIFDDDAHPTSLDLGSATDPLRDTLEVLRDPAITLSNRQLEQRTPLEWFEAGKLGMIAGYRDLTPVLRGTTGLHFDVLPMPSLGSEATVGHLTGLCIGKGPADRVAQAADFLVDLISDDSVNAVTATGSIVPTNLDVAFHGFLEPDQQPAHAQVFISSQRSIVAPPLGVDWQKLQARVDPQVEALFTQPVLDDLGTMLDDIDEASRAVLDPDYEPSDAPSGTPSGSASGPGRSEESESEERPEG